MAIITQDKKHSICRQPPRSYRFKGQIRAFLQCGEQVTSVPCALFTQWGKYSAVFFLKQMSWAYSRNGRRHWVERNSRVEIKSSYSARGHSTSHLWRACGHTTARELTVTGGVCKAPKAGKTVSRDVMLLGLGLAGYVSFQQREEVRKGLLSHGKDARKELRGVNVGVFNSKKEWRVAEAKDWGQWHMDLQRQADVKLLRSFFIYIHMYVYIYTHTHTYI